MEGMDHIIYKGNKYKRTKEGYYLRTERLHRRIWEDHFGQIPEKHHIHHKNGVKDDNRIENLECISEKDHPHQHFIWEEQVLLLHKARDAAARWHKSEEGRIWHMENSIKCWANRGHIPCICEICGKKYKTRNRAKNRFCSHECRKKHRYPIKKIDALCVICRKMFKTEKKKNHSRACSPQCGAILAAKVKREKVCDIVSTA